MERHILNALILLDLIMVGMLVYSLIPIWHIYRSPDVLMLHSVRAQAGRMLTCINQSKPEHKEEFNQIQKCIDEVQLKRVDDEYLPSSDTQAFVFRNTFHGLFKSTVFTTREFHEFSHREQSLVLIHECAHLALNARDYAYRWQGEFHTLTREKYLQNADTFVDWIEKTCYRRRRLREDQLGTAGFGSNRGDIGRLRDSR